MSGCIQRKLIYAKAYTPTELTALRVSIDPDIWAKGQQRVREECPQLDNAVVMLGERTVIVEQIPFQGIE